MIAKIRSLKADDPSPPVYPGLVLGKKIDAGGQAIVYKGTFNHRTVAVKVFQRRDGLEDLRNELRTLEVMGRHPNVVKFITRFEAPKPALVLRYHEGADLMDRIRGYRHKGRIMSYGRVLRYASGIAKGLAHMHLHGVTHRDFKSNNCLVDDRTDEALIIDFGLCAFRDEVHLRTKDSRSSHGSRARDRDRDREPAPPATLVVNPVRTDHVKGTPFWIAPEMIKTRQWDERSDVYSYGIVLWELNTCALPYQTPKYKGYNERQLLEAIRTGARPSRTKLREAETAPVMRRLIEACWDEDLRKRPSMRRVVEMLEQMKKEQMKKEVARR